MNRLDISACSTVTSERASVSHVHVEPIEAESLVRVEGGSVVTFDVQKDRSEAAISQVMHACESQHSAETTSLRRGIDTHDVHLPQLRIVTFGCVHLGPVKAEKSIGIGVRERHEQTGRVEPAFGRSLVDLRLGPATLLGMPGEGRIVDAKDLGIVFGPTVRPHRYTFGHNDFRKLRSIERSTQLEEFTNADQIEALGEFHCGVDVSVRPDSRARPTFVEYRCGKPGSDTAAPRLRVDHQLGHVGMLVRTGLQLCITDDRIAVEFDKVSCCATPGNGMAPLFRHGRLAVELGRAIEKRGNLLGGSGRQ